MKLVKINEKDIITTGMVTDECGNTELYLHDFSWMRYEVRTILHTINQGRLKITFCFTGCEPEMKVVQSLNGKNATIKYEFSIDIFKKHLFKFMHSHMESWVNASSFKQIELMTDFFNDVIENGTELNHRK